jgi:hypothetical protein
MHWAHCIKSQEHYFEWDDIDYKVSVVVVAVVVVVVIFIKFSPKTNCIIYIISLFFHSIYILYR